MCSFTAVRQDVKSFESLVVVHELEFAMKRALYGVLCSLGIQYIVGSFSCVSATVILKCLHFSIWSTTISFPGNGTEI